jgi:hypothetical protein
MLLTPKELHELTDCARKDDQIEWLRARGWVFEIGTTGRPKVDSAEYERHMIGGKTKRSRPAAPDLSWFNGPQPKAQ